MSKKNKIAPQIKSKLESDEISYKAFFQQALLFKLVNVWQEEEVYAFFKDLGLNDKEPVDVYKDALAKY